MPGDFEVAVIKLLQPLLECSVIDVRDLRKGLFTKGMLLESVTHDNFRRKRLVEVPTF
jgi:hypothetical protein